MQISESLLEEIKKASKIMTTDQQVGTIQRRSKQWGFNVEFDDSISFNVDLLGLSMKVFARQNTLDIENFSCGVDVIEGGEKITLSRYNGSNHTNDVADHECHIHHATAESINRGDRSPEHENTQVTDRYSNLMGAFKCLCEDYHIKWSDDLQTDLFGEILM